MSGAFVAGIDAGKAFNTWPLMNDEYFIKKALIYQYFRWFPSKYFSEKFTYWGNFIENKANVQFNHRSFAYLTYFSAFGKLEKKFF